MTGNTKTERLAADRLRELQRPVQFIRGVGPQRAELLEKLEQRGGLYLSDAVKEEAFRLAGE